MPDQPHTRPPDRRETEPQARGAPARLALVRALGLDPATLDRHVRAALEALGEEVLDLRGRAERLQAALGEAALLADNDTLCPVFNRRAFMRELNREIALAERFGTPLTLIYVDLDGFKAVNDRYGHGAGDEVLRRVASLLKAHTRETDIIARLGGDEFGVGLARADASAGRAKAAELAARIDRLRVHGAAPEAQRLPIGASCGVASWQRGWPPERLIAEADADMFAVKARRKATGPAR